MKSQQHQENQDKYDSDQNTGTLYVDGNALVVASDEIIELPKQCIQCCSEVFLNRREQEISSKGKGISKSKTLISFYLCQDHIKHEEKNGFLGGLWLIFNFYLPRFVPVGIAAVVFVVTGLAVFMIINKSRIKLQVKKFNKGWFWITGFSQRFLNDLNRTTVS